MESIKEIYSKYAKTVYKYFLIHTNNADLAEEFTQETFFRAVECINKYQGNSSISTWLCGIAKNVWYEYLRSKKKTNSENDPDKLNTVFSTTIEDDYFIQWDAIDILKQLHNLDEPMKEVIYLRLIGNLSFRQIGDIMNKSENWARVTFYRGKEKLIKEVERNE